MSCANHVRFWILSVVGRHNIPQLSLLPLISFYAPSSGCKAKHMLPGVRNRIKIYPAEKRFDAVKTPAKQWDTRVIVIFCTTSYFILWGTYVFFLILIGQIWVSIDVEAVEAFKRTRNSSLYASNSIDDLSSTKGRVCVSQEEANGIETHNHN